MKHTMQLHREVERKIADRKERRNYHAIVKSGVAMVAITESEILSEKILSSQRCLRLTNKKLINITDELNEEKMVNVLLQEDKKIMAAKAIEQSNAMTENFKQRKDVYESQLISLKKDCNEKVKAVTDISMSKIKEMQLKTSKFKRSLISKEITTSGKVKKMKNELQTKLRNANLAEKESKEQSHTLRLEARSYKKQIDSSLQREKEIGNKLNQYKLLKNNALKQARASKKSALIAVCNSKKRLRKLTMSTSVVEELKK